MKFGCDTIEISCNFLTPAHSTSSVSNLQAITRDEDDEHRRVYLLCPFSSGRVSQLHTQLTYLTHYPTNLISIYAARSSCALPGTGRFIWLVICLIAESASRMCARATSYSCDLCREQGLLLLCIWKDWHEGRTLFSPFLTFLCARHPFFSRWPFREWTHSYGHMSYCCAFTSHCPFISPYFSGRSLCYNLANSARFWSREMRLMACEVNKRSSKILISSSWFLDLWELQDTFATFCAVASCLHLPNRVGGGRRKRKSQACHVRSISRCNFLARDGKIFHGYDEDVSW
jgi:hypothetical protein